MRLDDGAEHARLIAALEEMPAFLERRLGPLDDGEAVRPGPGGSFSPVEQAWHLADLEREGYGVRIERLLAEQRPALPDFDGDRVARERNYRARSLAAGLASFREARTRNLARLRALAPEQWARDGVQEGVGAVTTRDVVAMMTEHDAAHRAEIEAWANAR
jgi:hypothetical protein